jgi:hypothetical protein
MVTVLVGAAAAVSSGSAPAPRNPAAPTVARMVLALTVAHPQLVELAGEAFGFGAGIFQVLEAFFVFFAAALAERHDG